MDVIVSVHKGSSPDKSILQSALVKVNKAQLNFSAAAIVSCGVMTGYGSVVNSAKLQAGSSVVVLGCGGVGLNVLNVF